MNYTAQEWSLKGQDNLTQHLLGQCVLCGKRPQSQIFEKKARVEDIGWLSGRGMGSIEGWRVETGGWVDRATRRPHWSNISATFNGSRLLTPKAKKLAILFQSNVLNYHTIASHVMAVLIASNFFLREGGGQTIIFSWGNWGLLNFFP